MKHPYHSLEFHRLLEELSRHAETEPARERIAEIKPSVDRKWVRDELTRVDEIRGFMDRGGNFPGGGVVDIRNILRKASVMGAVLSPEEILNVLHHLRIHSTTRKVLDRERERMRLVHRFTGSLNPAAEVENQIDRAISPEATVKDTASQELSRLRRAINVQQNRMREKLSGVVGRLSRLKALREESFSIRDGRYVLPVRSDALGKVKGIIHDRSSTGVTIFVEPTVLIELGNELRSLELAERDEVRRILAQLTDDIRLSIDQIRENHNVMTGLDCLSAKARLAERLDAHQPRIPDGGAVIIMGGRHPLLALGEGREVVPLTLELGVDYRLLVISGPNAGGKSVALKCVGLLCLMTSCGMPVPALPGTEIPLFNNVIAVIGDQQSISDDLSTFTAHARSLKEILLDADHKTLVLVDEIGAGTDPQEGASLSIAILEKLVERNTPTIVTTHHGALKAFAHSTDSCANGSMEFDMKTLQPTYRFRPNLPGSSYALEIGRRAGLSEEIINRARVVLGSERTQLEDLIASLTEKVRNYEKLVVDEDRKARQLNSQEEAWRQKNERLMVREQELKRKRLSEADGIIGEARKTIEHLVKEIRETNASKEAIKKAHETIDAMHSRVKNEIKEKAPAKKKTQSIKVPQPVSSKKREKKGPEILPFKEPEVGDNVTIDDSGTIGEILQSSTKKNRYCVGIGSVQLWVSRDRLKVVVPEKPQKQSGYFFRKIPDVPLELDIRGLDSVEAIKRVENYLYDGMTAGRGQLGIIHGKGAGILSRTVREHLSGHPVVKSYRFGDYGEGDYGITIVEIKASSS